MQLPCAVFAHFFRPSILRTFVDLETTFETAEVATFDSNLLYWIAGSCQLSLISPSFFLGEQYGVEGNGPVRRGCETSC